MTLRILPIVLAVVLSLLLALPIRPTLPDLLGVAAAGAGVGWRLLHLTRRQGGAGWELAIGTPAGAALLVVCCGIVGRIGQMPIALTSATLLILVAILWLVDEATAYQNQ